MLRAFVFLSLLMFISCEPEQVQPVENIDEDLDFSDSAFEFLSEGSNVNELCGLVKIDSSKNSYHIYFDKTTCTANFKRNGEIEVTLVRGSTWVEKDALMKISYLDYETEVLNQQSNGASTLVSRRIITGDQYVFNVTGGAISDFLDGKNDYLERKTRAKNLIVQFNANTLAQRYDEVSVKEFRREGDVMKVISRGDTTLNGYDRVQEWGVDIYNQRFYRIVDEPVIKTLCDGGKRWKFTQGTKTIYERDQYGQDQVRQKIFGVNQNGELDGTCSSYGYKITLDKLDGQIEETIHKY